MKIFASSFWVFSRLLKNGMPLSWTASISDLLIGKKSKSKVFQNKFEISCVLEYTNQDSFEIVSRTILIAFVGKIIPGVFANSLISSPINFPPRTFLNTAFEISSSFANILRALLSHPCFFSEISFSTKYSGFKAGFQILLVFLVQKFNNLLKETQKTKRNSNIWSNKVVIVDRWEQIVISFFVVDLAPMFFFWIPQ